MGRHNNWRSMTRSFAREYPHQVRLAHTGGWRSFHTTHALRDVRPLIDWRWWTEGNAIAGDLVSVWGFKSVEDLDRFRTWANSCGIDWSVAPDQQPLETRPPQPPEDMSHVGPAIYCIKNPPAD